MKKILLMLFILVFNVSFGRIDNENKTINLKERALLQSNNFSKCFKTGLKDFEEMGSMIEDFMKYEKKVINIKKDLSTQKIKRDNEEVLKTFEEMLDIIEIVESRLDHIYYFHASEIPSDMDIQLVELKKIMLEAKGNIQVYLKYIDYIKVYYEE